MQGSLKPLFTSDQKRAGKPSHFLWWIGGAIVLFAGLAVWRILPTGTHQAAPLLHPESAQMPTAIVSIQTASVSRTPQWLEVTGTVRPELEAQVAAKVLGRVRRVPAREGDRVRQGQTVVVLDARDLDAGVAQAHAAVQTADAGYDSARIAARMEVALSAARISEAHAKVTQSEAALHTATAKLDLVQAGPRPQEREQAVLAVSQAKSSFTLAESNLKRMAVLFQEGAISAQQYDQFRAQYEVAKSQLDTARQGKSIADEGSRVEEVRMARQEVLQAQAAVQEAQAGLKSAEASALQIEARRQEIESARAGIHQAQAGLQMARVTQDYATISAPFDGIVTARLADPGAMASPGMPLLKIQGGGLRLDAVVPESALPSVKKGATVPIRFDALTGRNLSGRVVEIAPQGDAGSHTFIVKIALPQGSGASAGMFGRARFTTGFEKRLQVPATAIFEREGLEYLYVVDAGNMARLRLVTVGDKTGKATVVLSGLSPGERFVAAGRVRLADSAPVAGESR